MNSLIQNVSTELSDEIRSIGHLRSYNEGAEIFAAGDPAGYLPIVVSGRVKMVKFLEPGKEVIAGIFGEGEIFAIPPVIDGGNYPATAIAMDQTKLLLIDRVDFLRLMSDYPEFQSGIMTRMCGVMRDQVAMIQTLATSSPEHRIINVLFKLVNGNASDKPVRITLRREDIAKMAGLTTETTIRVIRRIADKGLIKIDRGKIVIGDVDALKRIVES
ncbi:MAG: Crp/Fnr family transcriptional regulator [Pyrinomonadaceae bacterium]|nr:Crp/Fnr family transcriptional regulator [Pyrinomonadaceae bacterium]